MTGDPDARRPIVVLGGFLAWPGLYAETRQVLADLADAPVSVVPTSAADWLAAVSARGWRRILDKLDAEVRRAAAAARQPAVTLVGHSAGGVIGRLYLSPQPFCGRTFAGLERVSHLVTLGSPNTNQRFSPMRRRVDRQYPGAYFAPAVRYTSVAGRWREGRRRGTAGERAAWAAYRLMGGLGDGWGDGVVPVDAALLPGSRQVVLDRVGHAPGWHDPWYGSAAVVRQWWPQADSAPGIRPATSAT